MFPQDKAGIPFISGGTKSVQGNIPRELGNTSKRNFLGDNGADCVGGEPVDHGHLPRPPAQDC